MSLIERNLRVRTVKCKYCNVVYILNPYSERYHKDNKCKKMIKV